MKQTNVSQLKAHLSALLAEVRNGETIVVHDRRTPIARLVPYDESVGDLQVVEPVDAARKLGRIKPLRLRRRVDVVKLLRDSRDQR